MSSKTSQQSKPSGKPPPPVVITEEVVNERRKALAYRQASNLSQVKAAVVEEAVIDYNVVFSDKLEKLTFPLGLKQRPLGERDIPVDEVEARLAGLPGKLSLDANTTQKYFGPTARGRFFHRYQWLANQRLKTSVNGDPLDRLYFEEQGNEHVMNDSIPFQPVRSKGNGSGERSRFAGSSRELSSDAFLITQRGTKDMEEIDDLDEQAMLEELHQAINEDDLFSTSASKAGVRSRPATGRVRANSSANTTTAAPSAKLPRIKSRPATAGTIRKKKLSKIDEDIQRAMAQAKGTKTFAPDLYSDLILDSMLKPIATPEEIARKAALEARAKLSVRTKGDYSVASQSTVSTLGMFYNTDKLHSSTLQGRRGGQAHGQFTRSDAITSPRSRYIVGCIEEQLNPRASLLLRKSMSKQLNLQHLGMGNQRAKLLADAMKTLPYVEGINIADNMLTDDGMGPIILSAVNIPGLLELNLSQNTIGPVASNALFEYLLCPDCPLERLILNAADVDDYECKRFVDAIKVNLTLHELELSNNKVGMAENLNTVMPDIVTGGEALADLLRLPNCQLTKLKLDWNMIRLQGANDLAQSLSVNKTLLYLDLSYNSLATEGGILLGVSLLKNNTLETLVIANNALDATATFTICAGVIENRRLKKVVLDGNPIGIQGMRVLMLIPIISGNRVKVTATNCNISIKDPKCWFDFDKLIRDYPLRMENGFDRAVAIILLHLIAGHPSFIFSKFVHESNPGRNATTGKMRNIDLIQSISHEIASFFSHKQKAVLEGLQRVKDAASDIQTAIRLFQEVDVDSSGELDRSELAVLMKKMGLHISTKRLNDMMAQYDVDQGGKIEIHEFLMLLKSQHKEAAARIKELTEAPIMVLKSDNSKRYIPPESGTLHISVVDGFARKKIYRIMNACDREIINEVTKDVGGVSGMNMISSSLQGTKLRLDEALSVAETMLHDNPDKVAVLKKLLAQVNDAEDTRNLIQSLLDQDNRTDMMRLKRDMGAALRPILGNPNGYYILDMAKEMDRLCLEKLLEISMTNAVHRQEASKIAYGRVGDVSQKGNWSSFRNEMFEGEPITLTMQFAAPMPRSGKLEFDFSGGCRPNRDAMVLSDQRIIKTLMQHFLIDQTDYAVAVQKLRDSKTAAEKTLGCDGLGVVEVPMDKMRIIGEHIETFYGSLKLRAKQFKDAGEKEGSTPAVDNYGNLVEPFERDKPPLPLTISDYYIRMEQKKKEEEDALALIKAQEAEKAAMKADRQASLFGYGNSRMSTIGPPNPATATMLANLRASSVANPTIAAAAAIATAATAAAAAAARAGNSGDEDEASVSTAVTEGSTHSHVADDHEDHPEYMQHMRSMMTLKTGTMDYNDDADAEDPGELDANQSMASMDWMKEFELLKQAIKPKDPLESRKVNLSERRHNIGKTENHLRLNNPDEYLEKFQHHLLSTHVNSGSKAHRVVDTLEDIFSRSWIYARHLALILDCFVQFGYIKQTKYFGTYRVDLVVALFDRVVDLHNFECVLNALSPFEIATVYCRLGWLNIYNPCKPEGSWELDLSRREERVVAKTLCVLATHEPGDNWTFNTFRWMRTMESMPGWELTQPWLTEDGMPMRGLLNITYYSGEGKRKNGCRPYIGFRKALLNLVLINEDEIVQEDLRSKPPPLLLPGDKAFQRHFNTWDNYLAPDGVDPNRKR